MSAVYFCWRKCLRLWCVSLNFLIILWEVFEFAFSTSSRSHFDVIPHIFINCFYSTFDSGNRSKSRFWCLVSTVIIFEMYSFAREKFFLRFSKSSIKFESGCHLNVTLLWWIGGSESESLKYSLVLL